MNKELKRKALIPVKIGHVVLGITAIIIALVIQVIFSPNLRRKKAKTNRWNRYR